MKTNFSRLTMMGGLLIIGLSACSDTPKDKEEKVGEAQDNLAEAKEDYETSMTDSINEYARFKAETDQKLIDNDNRLAELRAKMKADKRALNADYEKDVAEMEKKNATLKEKLRNRKEDANDDWDAFKTNVNQEMDELGKSISEMAQENMEKDKK